MDECADKVLRDLFDEVMTKVCNEMIKKRKKRKVNHEEKT